MRLVELVLAAAACFPTAELLLLSAPQLQRTHRGRSATLCRAAPGGSPQDLRLTELAAGRDVLAALEMLDEAPPSQGLLASERRRAIWVRRVYEVLTDAALLPTFGSSAARSAWPLPDSNAALEDDELVKLVGFDRSVLAPAGAGGPFQLNFSGATVVLAAIAMWWKASAEATAARGVPGGGSPMAWVELIEQPLVVVWSFLFAAFSVTSADAVLLNGGIAESVRRTVDPTRRKRVATHEAGHFLLAYLTGLPIESVALSAWENLARGGKFSGAAGTMFIDPVLAAETANGSVKRLTLDRFCTVVMAGIAAEAAFLGSAEGGQEDERALVDLLTAAGFPVEDVRRAAVWGAANATLLLRANAAAFEALERALEGGAGVAGAVAALEQAAATEGGAVLV